MTLINYLNRVHFADNVLEDALWSELENRSSKPVLVVTDDAPGKPDLEERIRAGIPARISVTTHNASCVIPDEHSVARLSRAHRTKGCDTIVACGAGGVIDLAKVVRLSVSQSRPLSQLSARDGGGSRIIDKMPDMIAIPTIDGVIPSFSGLATASFPEAERLEFLSDLLIPTVTICDPVLTDVASTGTLRSTCAVAMGRCIEALISPNYNPPADGIALDGLSRAVRSMNDLNATPDLSVGREVMAACMNAALVQQKGCGLAHAIAEALDREIDFSIDRGVVYALLLPELVDCYARVAPVALTALTEALGVRDHNEAANTLRTVLAPAATVDGLQGLGVDGASLPQAATRAAAHRALRNAPLSASPALILTMLDAIH